MIPKEKAIELVDKFYQTTPNEYFVNEPIGIAGRYKSWEQSKKCALIAVDEILKAVDNPDETYLMQDSVNYWTEVKAEIERL